LWRDVDQDGEVVDLLLQSRRDGWVAEHFFERLIKKYRPDCPVGNDVSTDNRR
jgi:transposase-like protein